MSRWLSYWYPIMEFETQGLVYGALIPVLVSATILVFVLKVCPPDTASRSSALAVGVSFLVAYWLVSSPPLLPKAEWHWLPYLCAVAMVTGWVGLAPGVSTPERWALQLIVAALAGWFLVPTWEDLQPTRNVYITVVSGSVLLLYVCLEPLAKRCSGVSFPLLLLVVSVAGAVVLGLSGNLRFAQLAGILAAGMGGCVLVLSYYHPSEPLMRGAIPAFTVLLCGVMFTGYMHSYSNVPIVSYVLVPLTPVTLWMSFVGPLHKLPNRWRVLIQSAVVLVPLGIALALAAMADVVEETW